MTPEQAFAISEVESNNIEWSQELLITGLVVEVQFCQKVLPIGSTDETHTVVSIDVPSETNEIEQLLVIHEHSFAFAGYGNLVRSVAVKMSLYRPGFTGYDLLLLVQKVNGGPFERVGTLFIHHDQPSLFRFSPLNGLNSENIAELYERIPWKEEQVLVT